MEGHSLLRWLGIIAGIAALTLVLPLLTGTSTAREAQEADSVVIGENPVGGYPWTASVDEPEKPSDKEEEDWVCLSVFLIEPTSRFIAEGSELQQCGELRPDAPRIEAVAGGRQGGKGWTVLAMVLDGAADRLYFKLSGRSGQTVRFRHLKQDELGSISAKPLSSFAHRYTGRSCLRRFIAYKESGEVMVDSGRTPCSLSE